MSGKTVTEQLMAKRQAKKPFSQQTPGDVLCEVLEQYAAAHAELTVHPGSHEDPDSRTVAYLEGPVDLEAVARWFLHKVMASG